jgi:dTDP-4-amino-4,6-dideoxygalactose transaminase
MLVEKVPFISFNKINSQTKPQIINAIEQCIDGQSYILGDNVKNFEASYSKFNNVKYTIGVGNGLDALYLSLKALEIGKGDEVIVPSNTYIATIIAISNTGAKPIFVEPRLDTYNINPDKIEEQITSKTRAILPVHLYGQACEMNRISEIARKHNLHIIEDNAQAHGSKYNDQLTGSFGIINATSFYPGKNLGAFGDAGGITTNSEELYKKCTLFRNYGSSKKYYNEIIGYNSRLDEIQACVLNIKLNYLISWTEERQKIASWYFEGLKDISEITLPITQVNATHVYHLFTIRTSDRNKLQEYLSSQSIETLIHYPIPPHLQKAYSYLDYKKGDFPIAEQIAETTLSLPLHIGISKQEVKYVCSAIKEFFRKRK